MQDLSLRNAAKEGISLGRHFSINANGNVIYWFCILDMVQINNGVEWPDYGNQIHQTAE